MAALAVSLQTFSEVSYPGVVTRRSLPDFTSTDISPEWKVSSAGVFQKSVKFGLLSIRLFADLLLLPLQARSFTKPIILAITIRGIMPSS